MANRIENGRIPQFFALLGGAQHESAPAHIAAAHELDGKEQAFTENLQ